MRVRRTGSQVTQPYHDVPTMTVQIALSVGEVAQAGTQEFSVVIF